MQALKTVPRLKLVTFDVTNTLLTFRKSVGHEYRDAALKFNVPVKENSEERLNDAFRKHWLYMNKLHPNFGVSTGLTSKQWWSLMVNYTFREAGFTKKILSDETLEKMGTHLYEAFATSDCWSLKKGSLNAIRFVKDAQVNVKLGVISNSDTRSTDLLYELGIGHYFNFIIISAEAKCQKPDPKVFRLALKEAEVESGENALHIGDDVCKDYLAAKACGWNALLLKERRLLKEDDIKKVKNEEIVESLDELVGHPFLQSLQSKTNYLKN